MSNFTPTRMGAQNNSGTGVEATARANFLRLFSGEVATQINNDLVTQGRIQRRTISQGRSASFAQIGNVASYYHSIGTMLAGSQKPPHAERVINVDQLKVSDIVIAKIDEAMMHYDVRAPYSDALANAMSQPMDTVNLQCMIRAARSGPLLTGTDPLTGAPYVGGRQIVDADADTDAASLRGSLIEAVKTFDQKNRKGPFNAYMKPVQWWLLFAEREAMNQYYGGSGSYSEGKLGPIAGLDLIKTNNYPTANVSTRDPGWDAGNDYSGDFTNSVCVITSNKAVGMVSLLDVKFEGEYSIMHKGHLLTADYAAGHGVLSPADAIEINKASVAQTNV